MLNDISRGFQTSTTETIIFVIVLAVLLVGLMGYQLIQNRSQAKPKKRKRDASTQPVLHQRPKTRRDLIDLSRTEQRTLDHLSWFLKDPRRQDRLLDDESLLVRVARQGIREGIVTEIEVLRLLRKLQVSSDSLAIGGRSSTSIPTGSEASISDRNLNVAAGQVLLSDERGVRVQIAGGRKSMPTGTSVEVVCGGNDGLYRFHSTILEQDGKHLLLRHSRHVEHVQRRRYRRRPVEVPVQVRIPGITDKPITTRTYDLSVGGAALKNPRKRIQTGTPVECVLDAGGSSPITAPGTAVRTSRKGKTVHVAFGPLNEQLRHRLFRKVLRLGGPFR